MRPGSPGRTNSRRSHTSLEKVHIHGKLDGLVWSGLTSRQLSRDHLGNRPSATSGVDRGGCPRATGKQMSFPGCWVVEMGKDECEEGPKRSAVLCVTFQSTGSKASVLP